MTVALISVVIPCYCCSDVLERAVHSVLRQTLLPTEIILVDDASPDHGRTKHCIAEIRATYVVSTQVKIQAQYLERNQGPAGARNAGWDVATGRFVAFLDSDDSWAPEKLEVQYSWMLEHPDFGISCHQSRHVSDGTQWNRDGAIVHREISRCSLLLKNSIPTRSVMLLNRADFRFPPTMRYAEDYWLWLDMKTSGVRIGYLAAPLAFTYKREYGEGGLSENLGAMHTGVLLCYRELRKKRRVGALELLVMTTLEQIKHIKRLLTVGIFKARTRMNVEKNK